MRNFLRASDRDILSRYKYLPTTRGMSYVHNNRTNKTNEQHNNEQQRSQQTLSTNTRTQHNAYYLHIILRIVHTREERINSAPNKNSKHTVESIMSNQQEGSQNDEDAELVSEFPPPPIYYTQAQSSSLTPPAIPTEALARSTQKAVAQRKKRELEEQSMFGGSSFGVTVTPNMDALGGIMPNFGEEITGSGQVDEDGPTVAVFGEGCYVEVNIILYKCNLIRRY